MTKEELQATPNTYKVSCIKHGLVSPIVPEGAVSNVILAHQAPYNCFDAGINVERRDEGVVNIPSAKG